MQDPLYVANDEAKLQEARKLIEEELSKVRFSKNSTGIVVKADSLGSLESLVAGFEK